MTLGELVDEHFWLVFVFGIGGLVVFLAFPVIAAMLVVTALAVGLIVHSTRQR